MPSYPARRRNPVKTRPDFRGRGPGRRPVSRPPLTPNPLTEGSDAGRPRRLPGLPKPLVDFGKRAPGAAGKAMRMLSPALKIYRGANFLLNAIELFDLYATSSLGPDTKTSPVDQSATPPGYGWYLRHGYNDPFQYYWNSTGSYLNKPTGWNNQGFREENRTGPGTGILGGQAQTIYNGWTIGNAQTRLGFWTGASGQPKAQLMFFERITPAQHNYPGPTLSQWLRSSGAVPAAAPFPNGHPNAIPGAGQLPHLFPPGFAPDVYPSTSPGFQEAMKPLQPEPIRRVDSEPAKDPVRDPNTEPVYPGTPFVPSPITTPGELPYVYPPMVGVRPGSRPAPSTGSQPGQNQNRGEVPKAHTRGKPPKGVKERKSRVRQLHNLVGNVLGGWTEFDDGMKAAWDALPAKYQSKSYWKGKQIPISWKKRWNDVYQNWDKVDLDQFVKNMLKNQLEDWAIGKASQAANKVTRPPGSNVPIERLDPIGSGAFTNF